ncbi:MAG TPA: M28 family peptidase, partial [Flavobacteriaceae bacterium]
VLAIYWSFSALMPQNFSKIDTAETLFSTERALIHLKEISKEPHYVGSPEHDHVKDYIIKELERLGLETQIQEGYSYNEKWGSITKSKNILTRIKGSENTKALMLLSHYDSNPHSSLGASDAGSGVVTILEGLRAYLATKQIPKNDIIILISDAEELGLNGANLFVNQHPWAKDVGLILNFEARGSGGPSYMLIETNGGNHKMIDGFIKANPEFPVANSLAYSIYKMLPNDTDLTPMREEGDIGGFNFAFIDDHFDYHTAMDTYDRLDRNTLEHQGSYVMPLLNYFSNADLGNMKSNLDDIYFNAPLLKTISYPFSWIIPMLVLTVISFLWLLVYGVRKRALNGKDIAKGFIPLVLVLTINGLVGYFGWPILKTIYPQYNEILHGFTYNGHAYIWGFSFLAMAICFLVYHKFHEPKNTGSLLVAPLFLWLVICTAIAFKLKGASFFIVPLIFGLISLLVLIKQKGPSLFLLVFLAGPTLFILSPFVKMFPVGLGLKMIAASTVLITLSFVLLISVFGFFNK